MRKFRILSLLLLMPLGAVAAAYDQDMPVLMRALMNTYAVGANVSQNPSPNVSRAARAMPPARVYVQTQAPQNTTPVVQPDYANYSKAQYIDYILNSATGTGSRGDCSDRNDAYNAYFSTDTNLSGQITAREGGNASGRLDSVCDFLGYAHWCFALGFAYAVRDLDDPVRVNSGNKCLTYQEFCSIGSKSWDTSKTKEYISRIIDELSFYQSNIKNTSKNTVMITTETRRGQSLVTSTSWRVYDTDGWVNERVPASEMAKLLCR